MVKDDIITICRRMYQRGYVVASDGNISVKTESGYAVTAGGAYFSRISGDQILALDKNGVVAGERKEIATPTTELPMHMEIYRQRTDVSAVIHAHPPYCIAFSLLGVSSVDCSITEIESTVGEVPVAPPAAPGTDEVPESIRKLVKRHDAIILSNHGVVTVGTGLRDAYWKLERVEHFAKICYLAKLMKGGKEH